ncbi:hypothetical protein TspCOW1_15550 [Thiohalobacter sp. COW1]|uniref:Uncharacterized protein n=1 Tax=Thiohalobacter thiocyanaticus TaxID=585455 RepID=A0A1Z4VPE3_9GAMM|nr:MULTISPECIES: hypothetical protein [Thiohalobacter]BAZ93506.1 uncharacterized protein FOKN1_1107 [Thiohalobacter thiocyanaticus]BCO31452.1 hypothetical protein TspCOW1_15550 [Thiohalobacter sp. COW1]
MKKTLALLLALSGSSVALAEGNSVDYIPWTFDDFDSNCEVVAGPVSQATTDDNETNNSGAADRDTLDG